MRAVLCTAFEGIRALNLTEAAKNIYASIVLKSAICSENSPLPDPRPA